MAEYQLHCFAQSGNSYRVALMLNLIGADWAPIFVDYFGKGEHRQPSFRADVNEMGEIPVLTHGERKLTQSPVILTYLADRTGQYRPDGEDAMREALRWMFYDTHKVNGAIAPYRALRCFAKPPGDPAVMTFLKKRIDNALGVVNARLANQKFILGAQPTIADIALTAYLFYPREELGLDLAMDYPAIGHWLDRIRALPGWAHPYDLMPGHPLPNAQ